MFTQIIMKRKIKEFIVRYLLVEDFVQESQLVDAPTLLQGLQLKLLEQAWAVTLVVQLGGHMYW